MTSSQVDVYTHRPREPNDQYSVLTDIQIHNIKRDPSTFFSAPVPRSNANGPPREGGRYYRDRYSHARPVGNVRSLERSQDYLYIDEQVRPHDVNIAHDTCRGLASSKWGPQKIGDRTRQHFFGEKVEDFTTIDMYRRPATTYTGRVIMDCGRPGDGYYTQRFPDRASWNRSSVTLNCTNILDSVYRKTWAEHAAVRHAERAARLARKDEWPEMSEYTSRYVASQRTPAKLSNLEHNRRHAAIGQQNQEAEFQAAEIAWREEEALARCPPLRSIPTPIVTAS